MSRFKVVIHFLFLALFILVLTYTCTVKAEVVNSIKARINGHIITFRDVEIEKRIRSKMPVTPSIIVTEPLVWQMVDNYLLLLESQKAPGKNIEEKVENKLEGFKGRFKSVATYDEFLAEFELTEDDLYQIFKKRVLIEGLLRNKRGIWVDLLKGEAKKNPELTVSIKKKGSTFAKNMILSSCTEDELFQIKLERTKIKLREKVKIFVNSGSSVNER